MSYNAVGVQQDEFMTVQGIDGPLMILRSLRYNVCTTMSILTCYAPPILTLVTIRVSGVFSSHCDFKGVCEGDSSLSLLASGRSDSMVMRVSRANSNRR